MSKMSNYEITHPDEFESLYNEVFFGGFFDKVLDVTPMKSHGVIIQYDTPLSKPNSKLNAAEHLLYDVKIPENMAIERMTLLCLVSRVASMYATREQIKRGEVAFYIMDKMCHQEVDAKINQNVSKMRETAELAGTYLSRLAQVSGDSELKLLSEQWFRKAEEYGITFNPKEIFLSEAANFRGQQKKFAEWEKNLKNSK